MAAIYPLGVVVAPSFLCGWNLDQPESQNWLKALGPLAKHWSLLADRRTVENRLDGRNYHSLRLSADLIELGGGALENQPFKED